MQLQLMEFVKEPTWRELLLEAINSQQMNPWEIDLVKAADAYLQVVTKMQAMDLRVPANVILACALLLHYKTAALRLDEPEPEVPEEARIMRTDEAIPSLVQLDNIPRSRTITLNELIDAVEEVMGYTPRDLTPLPKAPPLHLDLPKENINELMAHVHTRAHELKDTQNILLFSDLVQSFNGHGEEKSALYSYHLLPILHLIQEEKIYAWQDRSFGEIFLKVIN